MRGRHGEELFVITRERNGALGHGVGISDQVKDIFEDRINRVFQGAPRG